MEKNRKIDEDLLSFIAESREIVEEIEPRLVKLGEELDNNREPDDETVNLIFRGFHTIKGTAAFYQLDSIVSLAHKAETLLEFFRKNHETINASCTDVLCHTLDVMEHLFALIEAGEGEESAQDKIRSIMFRLNGRIDALKRKTEDDEFTGMPGPETSLTFPGKEPYPAARLEEVQPSIGKYAQICLSESRAIMKKIMGMSFMETSEDSGAYREDELEGCHELFRIMVDSAGFLGFENLVLHLEKALDWIHMKDKDMDVKTEDVEYFKGLCSSILHVFNGIESSGTDRDSVVIELPGDETPAADDAHDAFCQEQDHKTELSGIFISESFGLIEELDEKLALLREDPGDRDALKSAKSLFHTLKGSAGLMGLADMEALGEKAVAVCEKAMEDPDCLDDQAVGGLVETSFMIRRLLAPKDGGEDFGDRPIYRRNPENERRRLSPDHAGPVAPERRIADRRDIRVSISKLDELINLVGELVIAENMVVKNPDIQGLELENFEKAAVHLRKIVRDLQDVALTVRMVPVSGVFRKMIRLVHDFSAKSDKKVKLRLVGEDTEIDKTVAELISDPLVHLVRNAIGHGIRKKPDKTSNEPDGVIILEARHEGGEVLILVKDSGDGLDTEKILGKALETGIVNQEDLPLSEKEIHELIFHPGFSTSDDVTDFSGRGVGMDVVRRNLDRIKGRVDVYSRRGKGCSFVLRIPLTLAIIDGMLVRVGESSYTIPLLSIRETIQVSRHQVTTTMDGQEMVSLRDQMIPVIRLHDIYGMGTDDTDVDKGLLVVVEHQDDVAGLLIHDILGEQQAVIKGMSRYMDHVMGISGCTILGDGEVSLILDVPGLIQKAQLRGMERDMTVH